MHVWMLAHTQHDACWYRFRQTSCCGMCFVCVLWSAVIQGHCRTWQCLYYLLILSCKTPLHGDVVLLLLCKSLRASACQRVNLYPLLLHVYVYVCAWVTRAHTNFHGYTIWADKRREKTCSTLNGNMYSRCVFVISWSAVLHLKADCTPMRPLGN